MLISPCRACSRDWPIAAGRPGDDAGEDQQGDPVADAFLRDLLAQPHHEHGTGDQGSNGNHEKHDAGVVAHALIGHAHGHARRLDYREHTVR
jgi:hypothetical protein